MARRRIFLTRSFRRWAAEASLTDLVLGAAVAEMEQGLVDAVLGAGLVKKRVRTPGRGRRGGARVILATNRLDRWIFIYGSSKSERSNITSRELVALQELSKELLGLNEEQIDAQTKGGALKEIAWPRIGQE